MPGLEPNTAVPRLSTKTRGSSALRGGGCLAFLRFLLLVLDDELDDCEDDEDEPESESPPDCGGDTTDTGGAAAFCSLARLRMQYRPSTDCCSKKVRALPSRERLSTSA
jgi:hypothetical protein